MSGDQPEVARTDERIRAGVVGLGTMGAPIALKLISCGMQVSAWNRTRSKAEPLANDGVRLMDSPRQVAAASQTVVSSVKDDAALFDVTFGPDGIAEGLTTSSVHCDTSTISPACAREIAEKYRLAGKAFVHAPVLGSKKQVAEGSLLMFACGANEAITAAEPTITFLAKKIWRLADSGSAAVLKLACNMMIASMVGALSQSMVFAAKQGVTPELLLDVLGRSNLNAPMYESKGSQILHQDWKANFFVDNIIKDVGLALDAADNAGVPMPMISLMHQYFQAASSAGYGLQDYSAVSKVFAEQAAIELRST